MEANRLREVMRSKGLRDKVHKTVLDEDYITVVRRKWDPMLEKVHINRRDPISCLLENQALYEAYLAETTGIAAVPEFVKVLFPVIRDAWQEAITPEIVTVQPMSGPIGGIFHLVFKYSQSKGSVTAGQIFPANFGAYYSAEYIDGEKAADGDGVKYGGAGAALAYTVNYAPVKPLDDYGRSVVVREETPAGVVVQTVTFNAAGTSGTGAYLAGAFNHTTGAITAFKFTNAAALGNYIKVYYYWNSEMSSSIAQVELDVTMSPVQAETSKLKTIWGIEVQQDMSAMLNINVDDELAMRTSRHIALEKDRRVLNLMYANSTNTVGSFDRRVPAGISEAEHLRALLTVIATVSQGIHTKTLVGEGNFIVTSPSVVALFSQFPAGMFVRDSMTKGSVSTQGIQRAGKLNDSWSVYKDPKFISNKIMIGLRGESVVDSGIVHAPYIPLMMTQPWLDPDTLKMVRSLMTRDALKLINADFYGLVTVNNLV